MPTSINRLPNELLGRIFTHCLPEAASFKTDRAPLLLSQVCSLWRTVALQTSELWTDVCLNDENLHRKSLLPLLSTWLERSSGQLIDVYVDMIWVDMTSRNEYRRRAMYQLLIATLHPYRHRIRTLSGVFPRPLAGTLFFPEMGRLQKIALQGFPDGIGNLVSSPVDLTTRLLCLTTVVCSGLPVNPLSICSQTQLRRLTLNPLSVHDACVLLATLGQLELVVRYKIPPSGRQLSRLML